MKTIHVLPLFILLSCCKSQTLKYPGILRDKQDTAYVLFIDGQSNANSHGENLNAQLTGSAAKVLQWDTATHSFHQWSAGSATRNGLQAQTAQLLSNEINDSVYVIKIAEGSLAISSWDNGAIMKVKLDSAVAQSFRELRNRNLYVKVLSHIWLQGEQNCVLGTAGSVYQASLDSLIDRFRRSDVALTNCQWVIVKLRADSQSEPSYQPGSVAVINQAYVNVAAAKTNVELIVPETIGATTVDGVHYTVAGYILIANAWHAILPP